MARADGRVVGKVGVVGTGSPSTGAADAGAVSPSTPRGASCTPSRTSALQDLAPVAHPRPTPGPAPAPAGGQPAVIGEPMAEAAVLGCVLRASPEQARAILGLLDEDCWSVPQHAHVAVAARVLLARGEPVDPVTVLGQLRRQGIENARTSSRDTGLLLVELCEAAPSVSSAGHYARIVLEHAYRRRVQAAALRLLDAADTADLTDLSRLVDDEHAAATRAGHRAAAPALLRALPPT